MKLRWQIAIGAVVCVVLLSAFAFAFYKSSQNKLELYKAELLAQGEKLRFEEIMTGPTNISDLTDFVRAANLLNGNSSWVADIDFEKYAEPGLRRRITENDPVSLHSYSTKLRETNWLAISKAMAEQEDSLQDLRLLLENPPNYSSDTFDDVYNLPNSHFVQKRTAALWFAASTMDRLRRGEVQGAIDELEMIFTLAELHSKDPTLVNQAVRVQIASLAIAATWEILNHGGELSQSQLLRLQEKLEALDMIAILQYAAVCERAMGISLFEGLQKQITTSNSGLITKLYFRNDELYYLKQIHRAVVATRQLQEGTAQEVLSDLDALQTELKEMRNSWRMYFNLIGAMAVPDFTRVTRVCLQAETNRRLALTAVALQRFHVGTKRLPFDLNELVPTFLPAVPLDYMDGKPLKYKLNPDGTFLLYSVGEDGKDDGGDPTPEKPVGRHDLWTGRDAVWPRAAN